MPIEADEPYSPGWWLQQLGTKLHERRSGVSGKLKWTRQGVESSKVRPPLTVIDDYLRGDPPLRKDIHSTWAAEFRQYLRNGRLHIAPLAVSAVTNRLSVRAFRTAAAGDELGDVEAHNLMRRNDLKVKARQIHDWTQGFGHAYGLNTPPDAGRPWTLMTAESPMHCITAHDAASGEEIAALKMFRDEWDTTDWAYLFLPGELYVAKAQVRASTLFGRHFRLTEQWEWDYDSFDDVPGNRVAMVRFENKDGLSEIEAHLDHFDRINDKLFNEWWIGKIQAFKQRALQLEDRTDDGESDGIEDLTDQEISDLFISSPDAMWQLPKGAQIWESAAVDVRPLIESVKSELQWAAVAMGIPLHTITPDAANGSAEGASLQRETSVDKASDRRDRLEGSWARWLGMAFEFQGMTDRADVAKIEVMWGPLERYSLSEKADAASKARGQLPTEAIWTDIWQYSPTEVIEKLRPLRARELFYAGLPIPGAGGQGQPSAAAPGQAGSAGSAPAGDED